jgi:hypothetical protein
MSTSSPTVKRISDDRMYIEYTRANSGIRVWKDSCQAIARPGEGSEWSGRERSYPLPVEGGFQSFPLGTRLKKHPALKLEVEVGALGHDELTQLVRGHLSFEIAISTQ